MSCGQLTVISVFNNNLEGPIPPCLGNCSSLTRTLLAYNQFTSIPTGFGRNSALVYLDVSYNQLAGPLPAGLGTNSSLTFLDLSANMLTGDMSILEFAQLGNLSSLHLAKNNLTGEIPAAMGLCNLLFVVELSYNCLTGAVPLALANLSALQELTLHGNNLTALNTYMYASFNGLTGSLPPQWAKFLIADPASFRGNPGLCMQYDTDNLCMEGLGEGGEWRLKLSERVQVAVGVGVGVVGVASWALGVLAALRFRRRKKPQVEPNIMPGEKITTQNLTKEPLPLTFEQILSATENMRGRQIIGKGATAWCSR